MNTVLDLVLAGVTKESQAYRPPFFLASSRQLWRNAMGSSGLWYIRPVIRLCTGNGRAQVRTSSRRPYVPMAIVHFRLTSNS